MEIVIDMNLSPNWVNFLTQADIQSVHWSTVGEPNALDTAIMEWARKNEHIVFTHDLDFGTLLALTQAKSPSVHKLGVKIRLLMLLASSYYRHFNNASRR